MSIVYRLGKSPSAHDRAAFACLAKQLQQDPASFAAEWLEALPDDVVTQSLPRVEGGIGGQFNRTNRQMRFDHSTLPPGGARTITVFAREPRVAGDKLPWLTCAEALRRVFESHLRAMRVQSRVEMKARLPKSHRDGFPS